MVVLWSLDFGEIEAVLAYALAAPILILFYFKVVGWFDSPSFSFLRGKGHTEIISFKSSLRHLRIVWRPITLAPHFKLRLYVEAAVIVIVSTDILSIIIFPPAYAHGWLYALLEYRQTPNGAHGSSYVLVLLLVLIASIKWDDALKGIIYGGLMVFIHEGMWFPFYYITNWGDLNFPLDGAFILWLLSMFYIATRKYHIVISKKSLIPYLALLLGWFSVGFPVTVRNVSRVYFETQWYGDIWVEGIEVVSWMIVFVIFLWNLKLNEPHGWKWIESIRISNTKKKPSYRNE